MVKLLNREISAGVWVVIGIVLAFVFTVATSFISQRAIKQPLAQMRQELKTEALVKETDVNKRIKENRSLINREIGRSLVRDSLLFEFLKGKK